LDDNRTFEVISIETANLGASILLTLRNTCPLIAGVDRVYLTTTGVVGYDGVEAMVEAKSTVYAETRARPDQIQLPIAFISDQATVAASALVTGRTYTIVTVGTTDWTLVGATYNTVGVEFVATGAAIGTGTAKHRGTLNTDASLMIFREGFLANELGGASGVGTRIRSSGRPMVLEARAYLNNGGTVYGNSMFRWRAPRSTTLVDETAPGGAFAVLPGNSADNLVRFFIGAVNSAVDLTGDADAIKLLSTGKFEIQNNGNFSGYYGSTSAWCSLSRTTSSFLAWDTNAGARFIYSNDDTGTAASANIEVRNTLATLQTAVRMAVYSTGFTPSGIAFADGGAVYSDTLLSGGLSVAALAGQLRLASATGERIYAMSNLDVGNRTPAIRVEALRTARTLSAGIGPTAGFSSQDLFDVDGQSYIAFDDRSEVEGTIDFGFHKSFQARPDFTYTGAVTELAGYSSEATSEFIGQSNAGGGFTSQIKGAGRAATTLVNGVTYRIVTVGTTDFTLIGAASNTVGLVFTATGPGTGTGTASGALFVSYRHFYVVNDSDYGGRITNQYGLYMDTLTQGITSNWGIWVASNDCHFGGDVEQNGDLSFNVIAKGLHIKSGAAHAKAGNATLVGGTVTVTNTTISANSVIYLSRKTAGGTTGELTYTLSAGASFTINSASGTDTSVVSYFIVELIP